jgi:methenyltetrahydromethanopterin cyclohydrolase
MVLTSDIKQKVNDLADCVASQICEEYGVESTDDSFKDVLDDEIYDFEKLKAKIISATYSMIDDISDNSIYVLK